METAEKGRGGVGGEGEEGGGELAQKNTPELQMEWNRHFLRTATLVRSVGQVGNHGFHDSRFSHQIHQHGH